GGCSWPLNPQRAEAGIDYGARRDGMLINLKTLVPASCVGALVVASAMSTRTLPLQAIQSTDSAAINQVLQGTIDIHVHAAPDNVPRSIDGLDVAKLARTRGMRGIVLKNHYEPTATLAFFARKEAPGLEAFGGIDLNLTVGGMNPAAVEHMTQMTGGGGRVGWVVTVDGVKHEGWSQKKQHCSGGYRGRP